MPDVIRTPVRAIAARIWRVRRRVVAAGHDGLMNSCVSCTSRIFILCAMASMRSSGSAKRFTSGLVLSARVKAIFVSSCLVLYADRSRSGSGGLSVETVEPRTERCRLVSTHMQSVLGAPCQDVRRCLRPLMRHEVAPLGLVERRSELPAEIGKRPGGADHLRRACTVSPRVVKHQILRQP